MQFQHADVDKLLRRRQRAHRRRQRDGQPGAAGYIAGDDGKPRCFVRVCYST